MKCYYCKEYMGDMRRNHNRLNTDKFLYTSIWKKTRQGEKLVPTYVHRYCYIVYLGRKRTEEKE